MKFYSEILDELFNTQEELEKKEKEQEEKDHARELLYNSVISAAEARDKAQENFETLRNDYVKKYGAIALGSENGKYKSYPFDFLFFNR